LIQLQLFAKLNNRYIYRWKIPLTTSAERLIATHNFSQLNEIYEKIKIHYIVIFAKEHLHLLTKAQILPTVWLDLVHNIQHEGDIACGFIPDDDGIITFIRPHII